MPPNSFGTLFEVVHGDASVCVFSYGTQRTVIPSHPMAIPPTWPELICHLRPGDLFQTSKLSEQCYVWLKPEGAADGIWALAAPYITKHPTQDLYLVTAGMCRWVSKSAARRRLTHARAGKVAPPPRTRQSRQQKSAQTATSHSWDQDYPLSQQADQAIQSRVTPDCEWHIMPTAPDLSVDTAGRQAQLYSTLPDDHISNDPFDRSYRLDSRARQAPPTPPQISRRIPSVDRSSLSDTIAPHVSRGIVAFIGRLPRVQCYLPARNVYIVCNGWYATSLFEQACGFGSPGRVMVVYDVYLPAPPGNYLLATVDEAGIHEFEHDSRGNGEPICTATLLPCRSCLPPSGWSWFRTKIFCVQGRCTIVSWDVEESFLVQGSSLTISSERELLALTACPPSSTKVHLAAGFSAEIGAGKLYAVVSSSATVLVTGRYAAAGDAPAILRLFEHIDPGFRRASREVRRWGRQAMRYLFMASQSASGLHRQMAMKTLADRSFA